MRIAIVTDAWAPQVNGVVKTLENTGRELRQLGHDVHFVTPTDFNTIPCPTYPSIQLALFPYRKIRKQLEELRPDAIHIATEGPLGQAARRYCLRRSYPFTTSWHTQFPEYVRLRVPIPLSWTYAWLRRFHNPAEGTLVTTQTILENLKQRGFEHLIVWSRGVDTNIFHPGYASPYKLPRPVAVYMGRVAVEKNIEAFLELKLPGSKLVVGDGPDMEKLRQLHPETVFVGEKFGKELAAHVGAADVFVFPSRTDTFGLVLLEAMACGVPIAAYPVQGPLDVVKPGVTGVMDEDLSYAILNALKLDRDDCVRYAAQFTWQRTAKIFLSNLASIERSPKSGQQTASVKSS